MSSTGDVTRWLRQLKAADRAAVQPLWEVYFHRLVGLARERLRGLPRAAADEEDVALSAFDSFCRRAEEGRFPRLDDRDDLWQLLAMIAGRKAVDIVEREGRGKRDWKRTTPLAVGEGHEPFVGDPDPATASEMADQLRHLLALLPDDALRTMAIRKLEGCTNQEIGKELSYSRATVERRLALIRTYWGEELLA